MMTMMARPIGPMPTQHPFEFVITDGDGFGNFLSDTDDDDDGIGDETDNCRLVQGAYRSLIRIVTDEAMPVIWIPTGRSSRFL